ncbi:MAG: quinoprotein dehydrogenase-associated putative ABC transporter substrate-binding protein [Betaproteobacteria bacterium HGW-Betaproteobacteria-22]|nr:MAG: quinoprotein dehydrogenase-associated putative ABC transporter substrate-binding protein [Betaproteobacteria bacterium HGW-Betaproteobacteria-22]
MFKKINLLGLLMGVAIVANVQAEDYYSSGRAGEVQRVDDGTEFKVCADQDNLPYSNSKQEGFENKIAEVLAQDLGLKIGYQFWYDRMGFLRNTLNAKKCDVVMGTTSDYDALRTSKPYYRSGHVFVYKKDSGYKITDWDSPDLKKARIGIVGQSPATIPLDAHGLLPNARPYRMQRDLNLSPGYLVDDLLAGDIDVAILWGPIGGYYAKQATVPLEVVLIPEYEQINAKGKTYWNISVGVRKADKERMAKIEGALERNKDKIEQILKDYGIPHVPVVEGDSLMKVYRKGAVKNQETRGDAIPKTE